MDLDLTDRTLPKKIREGQISQYNYLLVVGEQEVEKETISVRTRDGDAKEDAKIPWKIQDLLKEFDEKKMKFL